MVRPLSARERGLQSYYKVRVVVDGALLHLASWDEPKPARGTPTGWIADWIDDPDYGDTIGFIDWDRVIALSWRWAE